jgi:hypothetical protein
VSRVGLAWHGWLDTTRRELDEIAGGWARPVWAAGGVRLAWIWGQAAGRRERDDWPESWSIAVGGLLLGLLAWLAFATRVPNIERTPPEVLFGFLGLYFYSAGYLSGCRTGKIGTGGWAGAACGLMFGAVVCLEMLTTGLGGGFHETVRSGAGDQVAIAWSGLVFFVVMGIGCGALGARSAVFQARTHRQRR